MSNLESDMADKKISSLYVLDTSVIVDGRLVEEIRQGDFDGKTLIVPDAILAELEYQASRGQEIGHTGLKELKNLQKLSADHKLTLRYAGPRPQRTAEGKIDSNEVDAMVCQLAEAENAVLMTSHHVQALVAQAKGIALHYAGDGPEEDGLERLRLLKYFDETTMSVHLRVGTPAKAKKGTPGKMEIVALNDENLTERELERVAQEIVEMAEVHPDGFIELDMGGATVVQLKDFRIVIAHPPFSDALEITAVRPVAFTTLDNYRHAELLKKHLQEKYRGVLVAGAPGAGKSTFVQAMVDMLETSNWVVKTMEKPRDLQVSEAVTQYTALDGDMANTANILLLVRPDYTVFDEMRETHDFQVFADMRLAGVGLVGVVHATRGIDSLQRLIGRVELGMIPQVVDTVVYIQDGDVAEVLEVGFTVKSPAGMGDSDLARPVIEVIDFDSKQVKYEIYTFGDQVVVMPIEDAANGVKPLWKLAERQLERELNRELRTPVSVEFYSDSRAAIYVDDRMKPQVIGKGGSRITEVERKFGFKFDVRTFREARSARGEEVNIITNGPHLIIDVPKNLRGQTVEITVEGDPIFKGASSKNGSIKLEWESENADMILDAMEAGERIYVRRAH
jgi:ATPase